MGGTTVNTAATYNGTSWSAIATLTTARRDCAGGGTVTNALVFGGGNPSALTSTEKWDGSSWSSSGNMNTARKSPAGDYNP